MELDDTIKSADDLRKILDEAGLKGVPVFDLTDAEIPRSEEMQKLIEAIRRCGDGTCQ